MTRPPTTRPGRRTRARNTDPRRSLPAIERLLNAEDSAVLITDFGRVTVRDAYREVLTVARDWIRRGGNLPPDHEIAWSARQLLDRKFAPAMRRVINATGVIFHPVLGHPPLSESAHSAYAMTGYHNGRYDLHSGTSTTPYHALAPLIHALTGAEAVYTANTLAVALWLTISALAAGKTVLIPRAECLGMIGGWRITDSIAQGGATLHEIGASNHTRREDLPESPPENSVMVRVLAAFAPLNPLQTLSLADTFAYCRQHNIVLIVVGESGALLDGTQYGLPSVPTLDAITPHADLTLLSGNLLLGGPRAGIVIGRQPLIDRLVHHPLGSALEADAGVIAALIAALEYYRMQIIPARLPVWQMVAATAEALAQRARLWQLSLSRGEVIAAKSLLHPDHPDLVLPGAALAIQAEQPDILLQALRNMSPPVVARTARGAVLFDPRTVLPDQDEDLLSAISRAL